MPSPLANELTDVRALCQSVVSLIAAPAAVVAGGEHILAFNEQWVEASGRPQDDASLRSNLGRIEGFEGLVNALRAGESAPGAVVVRSAEARPPKSGEPAARQEFVARFRKVDLPTRRLALAMIVLEASRAREEALVGLVESQRTTIDSLLVRQSLIEENERREIGRALHDQVAQDLAMVRRELAKMQAEPAVATPLVARIDAILEAVRSLSFELSPPVLEELGLVPALQWLAEHMSERFEASITVECGDVEPRLTHAVRTIIFRAVRELATNAVRHARGARIVLSCEARDGAACFGVRDDGPGFSLLGAAGEAGHGRFGLLSVQQQIRGIGGRFEMTSEVGAGTSAAITVPIDGESGPEHG